ncbi:MAG TPA: hypothetical protein PK542_06855 [Treponemataceae bacterium]|nr:hypothetical protein [Treponemataceae bacterium]HPS44189.1 hypothetical protein [Treponemataceae bacterium]
MKRTPVLLLAVLLSMSLAPLCVTGCTYRNQAGAKDSDAGKSAEPEKAAASWYYFSDTGIHAATSPQEIPARKFTPWTEAVRVADACVIDGTPAFLINHLGIMTTATESGAAALHQEGSLFPASTAGGIYRSGESTLVRLYRNTFFSDGKAASGSDSANACIARYEGASGTFTPILSAPDFGLSKTAQCVALDRIGSMWYASFKDESAGKVDFAYLEFPALPTEKANGITGMRRISKDDYQKSVTPFAFKDAPEALVTLLAGIPADTAFNLKVHSPSAEAAETFVRDGTGTPVEGTALVSGEETAALFADGSFYFRPAKSDAKVAHLQLPALSRGYVYTDFVIAGKKILAAWEEQRFFETGRAGLLEISIPDGVY